MNNNSPKTVLNLLERCKAVFTANKLSLNSRKLYLADIKNFLLYLAGTGDLLPISELGTTRTYRAYLKHLTQSGSSKAAINRSLASLRQLGKVVASTYGIPNPAANLSLAGSQSPISSVNPQTADHIKSFTNHLNSAHLSQGTIKSYKSDTTQYLQWAAKHLGITDVKRLLTKNSVEKYVKDLNKSQNTASSTVERKNASLTRFADWFRTINPVVVSSDNVTPTERLHVDSIKLDQKLSTRFPQLPAVKNKKRFVLPAGLQFMSSYVSFALLILLLGGMGFFGFRQFSKDRVILTQAYPTTPVTPNRQISFQGRLETSSGTPITSSTNFVFKLFDTAGTGSPPTGGTQLYTSGTCSITPDSDGVFSSQIGSTCGSAIASSVFTENANVWLEVTVGAEELDPRQQIATVAYALNAETLQGYPISATVSAITNTVVPMNQWGEILVGEQSPRLRGVSGNFQISAPTLTLTTNAGTNGNVVLDPDGTGQVNVVGATTTTNFFNVSNPSLTTGSLITGTVANNNTGLKLFDLLSGSSPTSKFSVTDAGNVTMAGDLTITGDDLFMTTNTSGNILVADGTNYNPVAMSGDVTINGSGVTAIGADKITEPMLKAVNAPTDEMCLSYESTVGDFEWQTCGSGGANFFKESLGAISPINDTWDFLVGNSATGSARAGFIGINVGNVPTATLSAGTSGGAYLTADGTLATTAKQSLNIGNSTTGNINIGVGAGDLFIGAAGTAVNIDFAESGSIKADAGKQITMTDLGNVTPDANNTYDLGSNALRWANVYATNFLQAGNQVCDSSGLGCPAGSSYWRLNAGTISPANDTLDLLVGANATSSAKFAVIGVNGTSPIASVSGGVGQNAAYLTSTGTLATARKQTLTLGDANTGNIVLAPGGTTALTGIGANLTAAGNLNLTSATNLIFGGVTSLGETTANTDSGAYVVGAFDEFTYSNNTNVQGVLKDFDTAIAGAASGGGPWIENTGAIVTKNSTEDVLIGGSATASAKFAFKNVNSGVPTASISGTVANQATFLDGNGYLSSTSRKDLTIGNSSTYNTTGNTLINPNGVGLVGIGDTTPDATFDVDSLADTGTGIGLLINSLTTGTGLLIDQTANTMTTGTLLQAQSTATSLTTAGDAFLGYFNWSPGSSTTATGDLFRINIGANGTATNLFNVTDNGSSLFRVSETQVESTLPTSFTSAGDVSMAYDLIMTNQTSSSIKSYGPMTVEAGESFESNNLTLKTYNSGDVVIDSPGGVTLNQAQAWDLANTSTTALNIESGLMNFDTTNSRVGIGTTGPDAKLDVLATTEQLRLTYTDGSVYSSHTVDASGNLTIDNTGTKTIIADDLQITGDDLFMTTNTAGMLLIADGTNFNPTAVSGDITINGSGVTAIGADKITEAMLKSVNAPTDEMCLTYESTVGDFEWQTCGSGGTQYWRENLGTLSPVNDTYDFLIGSNASSSAKFAVLNVNSGTPVASISAGAAGAAYLTASGAFSTTNRQSLTIGNSAANNTTGNLLLNPSGVGYIGIGTTAPTAQVDIQGASSIGTNGSEQITVTADRDFSSSSGNWSGTNWTIGSGVATHTAGANNFTLTGPTATVGTTYIIRYTVTTTTTGTLNLSFGGMNGASLGRKISSNKTNYDIVTAATTGGLIVMPSASWAGSIDNMSVIPLTASSAELVLHNTDGSLGPELRSGGNTNSENTFLGNGAGQYTITGFSLNTGIGAQALARNTMGDSNTAVGFWALGSNSDGDFNTAVGEEAMASNTSGSSNNAFGRLALGTNTIGSSNNAFGNSALGGNWEGTGNNAYGEDALSGNYSGDNNAAFGTSTMTSNVYGSFNSAFGTSALGSNSSGNNNSAFGSSALANVEGSNNLGFGFQAGDNLTSGSNNIVIGYDIDLPSATGSNQLDIGNIIFGTGVSGTGTTIAGLIGIGTTGPDRKLDILDASNPQLRLTQADGTVYTDFQMTSGGDLVMGVDGVTNQLVLDDSGKIGIGTAAPTYSLTVTGGTSNTIGIEGTALSILRLIDTNKIWDIKSNGSFGSDLTIRDANNGKDRLNIKTNGDIAMAWETGGARVSVGGSNPLATFDVRNTLGTIPGASISGATAMPMLVVDQSGVGDIINGSSSGAMKFRVAQNGNVYAASYISNVNTANYLDPASTTTSLAISGDIVNTDAATFTISTDTSHDLVLIAGASNSVKIGAGGGDKLDAGTIDPPYTINGEKFATYMAGMTGVKEETTGIVNTYEYVAGVGYRSVIDFTTAPQGSDLWLFSKVTHLRDSMNKMVVLLSPGGNTKAWYRLDAGNGRLEIYTSSPSSVSYRLTAPRFDSNEWANTRDNDSTGHVLNDPNDWHAQGDTALAVNPTFDIVKENQDATASGSPKYNLVDSAGNILRDIVSASEAVIANLRAGSITTEELHSPLIETDHIVTDGTVIISRNTAVSSDAPLLQVEGEVAAASISARTAKLDEIKTNKLYADEIVTGKITAGSIEGLDAKIASLSAGTNTGLSDSDIQSITDRIKARIAEMAGSDSSAADLPAPAEATQSAVVMPDAGTIDLTGNLASASATLNTLDANMVTINNFLAVLGKTTMTSLEVTGGLFTDTISSTAGVLDVQPLGGTVKLAAGTMIIDSTGQVAINGDLTVTGKVLASSADLGSLALGSVPEASRSSALGALLAVYNEQGQPVATIDASGSATLAGVTTKLITISDSGIATPSATTPTTTASSATAGQAKLAGGTNEITIESPYVTASSLVYLTPTTDTANQVLYIKAKKTCAPAETGCVPSFTVGMALPTTLDVSFNWWIIDVANPSGAHE